MDTNRIKRFATEARTRLKEGVAAKIITLGFDKKGNVKDELKPQLMQGGTLWNGQLLSESFYHQWMSLYRRVQQKGINEAYEEAAYTWFNRLCAIRILQKNNLCAPVLDYADSARTPLIVDEARQGRIPQMTEEARARLMELLDDDTKVTEQFAVLITAWCHDNPIINSCFGQMADYTELLLPNNILAENGFVDMLNHTDYITDADYRSPELIGWLYQFYISERKDEVFAKKGKLEADEIPAATQIFTPNWIVKYMVQNTVGRIYLDNNPYERQLQRRWQYLVEPPEKTASEDVLHYDELTDLRVADLACGSGHILNECFDLLYDLYIAEGYGRGEAIENIFRHNLTGIDIDLRAKQLAAFALLLKACQKDKRFVDGHCMPKVLDMPKTWDDNRDGDIRDFFHRFFQGRENSRQADELAVCFGLMQNAGSLGSLMKFNIGDDTRLLLKASVEYWQKESFVPDAISKQMPAMQLILALTEKYHVLIANPPYMGRGNMNATLSNYLDLNYPATKADLFAAFMEMMIDKTVDNGRTAFITMESWMFLSSFGTFRRNIVDNYYIASMGHFGWHIIGIAFGTAMTVLQKSVPNGRKGEYSYLTIDDVDRERNVPYIFPKKDNGRYAVIRQDSFEKIPGCPIAYWVSDKIRKLYKNTLVKDIALFKRGIGTGNNDLFLRLWFEISIDKFAYASNMHNRKWQKYNKGGTFRKWFGNREYVINWENEGEPIINNYLPNGEQASRPQNLRYNYLHNISYSSLTSGMPSFREYDDFLNDQAGNYFILSDEKYYASLLALLNSSICPYFKNIKNNGLNITADDLLLIPFFNLLVDDIVSTNIAISKLDWDAHETSWDFRQNELVALAGQSDDDLTDTEAEATGDEPSLQKPCSISAEAVQHLCKSRAASLQKPCSVSAKAVQHRCKSRAAEGASTGGAGNVRLSDLAGKYHRKWEALFMQLHANEEELNRRFIDIYGLQDELSPEVPLSEVTILQAGEITIEEE